MARNMTRPLGGKMGEGMGMPRRLAAPGYTNIDRTEEFAAKWANPSILATTTLTGQTGFDGIDLFWRDENQTLYFFGTNGNGTYVCDLTWNGSGWTEGTWYQISSVEKQHERCAGCMITDTIGFVAITESASYNDPTISVIAFEKGTQASSVVTSSPVKGHVQTFLPVAIDSDNWAILAYQRTNTAATDTMFGMASCKYVDGTNTLTIEYNFNKNLGYSGSYYANGYMPRSSYTQRIGITSEGDDAILCHIGNSGDSLDGVPPPALMRGFVKPTLDGNVDSQIVHSPLNNRANTLGGGESCCPFAVCNSGIIFFPNTSPYPVFSPFDITHVRFDLQDTTYYSSLNVSDGEPYDAKALPNSDVAAVIIGDTLNTKTLLSVVRAHIPDYAAGETAEHSIVKLDFEVDASIRPTDSGRLLNWGDRLIWGAHDKIYVIEA